MNYFQGKKNLLIIYSGFLFFGLVSFILIKFFPVTPFTIFLFTYLILLASGFSLGRIFKFKTDDFFDQLAIWLILGLVFAFSLCFLAILIQINLTVLLVSSLIILISIFLTSLIIDLRKPFEPTPEFNYKSLFKTKNLIWLAVLVFLFLIIASVSQQGASFIGDPTYWLSIMEKAISGRPLGVDALSFLKNQPRPGYLFMIWPVFLSALAKILNLATYNLWGEIPAIIMPMIFLAWYVFSRYIFSKKYLAVFLLLIMTIFLFGNNGYLFTALPVPDVLVRLAISPLIYWLTFKYILDKEHDLKLLVVQSLLLFFAAGIHLTQYFYFYLLMAVFILGYTAISFREKNFLTIFKRTIAATFANLLLFIPIFGFVVLKTGILKSNFDSFTEFHANNLSDTMTFAVQDTMAKIAYICLPLALLFIRRQKKALIIVGAMLIMPILYNITPLKIFLNNKLSFVFMARLGENLTWDFAIWAILCGFILILIDRLLSAVKPIYRYLLSGFLVLMAIWLWFERLMVSEKLFSHSAGDWLNNHLHTLIGITVFLTIIIFIFQLRSKKVDDFFQLETPKNYLVLFCLSIALLSCFFTSGETVFWQSAKANFTSNHWFKPVNNYQPQAFHPNHVGGWDMLSYIQKNIPDGAILESNDAYRDLPTLADVHMAAWPYSSQPEHELSRLYESSKTDVKLQCLSYYNIEYILYINTANQQKEPGLSDLANYLIEKYKDDNAILYQIDQAKVKAVVPKPPQNEPDCRAREWRAH
jgi:hypothetical protein